MSGWQRVGPADQQTNQPTFAITWHPPAVELTWNCAAEEEEGGAATPHPALTGQQLGDGDEQPGTDN